MPTSAPGNNPRAARRADGFTLLELMVVVAIAAIATLGVGFAVRDASPASLEREAQRLAALLESGRAQSRLTGQPVRWRAIDGAFRFDGLPEGTLPQEWLAPHTRVVGPQVLLLGPEPIIGAQAVTLVNPEQPGQRLHVATDGLRPFQVSPATP